MPLQTEMQEKGKGISQFVCTATCNVHIEVTTSLFSMDFLHAIRRFSALSGVMSKILSDNGHNFQGAARSLSQLKKDADVQTYLTENGITWEFQTPKAPWRGGHFDCLIAYIIIWHHNS